MTRLARQLSISVYPILALISGCSSIQIDTSTEQKFIYETETVNEERTYCYTDKKTKSEVCNTFVTPVTKVLREVSVAKAKEGGDCYLVMTGYVDADLSENVSLGINAIQTMNCTRKVMVLNSQGGSVTHAMKIGIQIRKAGMSTLFDSASGHETRCSSACTLIFLGGVERIATKSPFPLFTSDMVFHKWSQTDLGAKICAKDEKIIKGLLQYTHQLLPPKGAEKYIDMTIETECDRSKSYGPDELLESGIATSTEFLLNSPKSDRLAPPDSGEAEGKSPRREPVVPQIFLALSDQQRVAERPAKPDASELDLDERIRRRQAEIEAQEYWQGEQKDGGEILRAAKGDSSAGKRCPKSSPVLDARDLAKQEIMMEDITPLIAKTHESYLKRDISHSQAVSLFKKLSITVDKALNFHNTRIVGHCAIGKRMVKRLDHASASTRTIINLMNNFVNDLNSANRE